MADCFSCFYDSDLGLASIQILEAFGYQVVLKDVGCCGRTNISVGRLGAARKNIEQTAPALEELRKQHNAVGVVVPEPSCASAMQEDWENSRPTFRYQPPDRLPPTPPTSNPSCSPTGPTPRRPDFTPDQRAVVVHTHCHAKHEGPVVAELLQKLGFLATEVDSGCCGLAGSLVIAAECDDVSRAVAEQSLGPHLRAHPEALVVAHGTSCRHQVKDVFLEKSSLLQNFWPERWLRFDLLLLSLTRPRVGEDKKNPIDTQTITKAIKRRTESCSPKNATANVNCNVGAMYCMSPTTDSGSRFADALKKQGAQS